MNVRIVLVGGARPNFVKLAPVLRALGDGMSATFFKRLGLPESDAYLNVGSGSDGAQTGRVRIAFKEYLLTRSKPAGVVVVRNVNSTAACAMTAVKLGILVAHVEASLRSFDRSTPEEINPVVTDAIADLRLVSEPNGQEDLAGKEFPPIASNFLGT